MPPFSGHAILCKQGRWGRGALPRTYVSVVTVSSVGGKAEGKNIQFLSTTEKTDNDKSQQVTRDMFMFKTTHMP